VHHLERLGGGGTAEIIPFEERHGEAPCGGVPRHGRATDAPAHDDQIELTTG
jgi:hypothetical protein